jgi:hypothetical protein
MLKIVDCAIAVSAVTTNKSATNNPARTLKLFTVLTRLSPIVQKKTPSFAPTVVCNWTPSSSEFFAAQLCAARQFCSRLRLRLSTDSLSGVDTVLETKSRTAPV